MIIYSALASLAFAQATGIIANHPLFVSFAQPANANYYDNPIGRGACTNPEAVQIRFDRSAAGTSGALGIYLRAGVSCTVTVLPEPGTEGTFLNTNLANVTVPDFFPRQLDVAVFSTKTVLDSGGFCADGKETDLTDYVLCVTANPSNVTGTSNFIPDQAQFRVDTKAPKKVEAVTANPGNARLTLGYTRDTTDLSLVNRGAHPAVYIVEVYEESTDVSAEGAAPLQSLEFSVESEAPAIEGLSNGVTYKVRMKARDIALNESEWSEFAEGTPVRTCDFWNCDDGVEKGGFCFIATAAYGSYDAPFVQTFRAYRDRVLLKTDAGRAFVSWYYRHGAEPARFIAQRPWARAAAATMLVIPYIAVWPIVHLQPSVWIGACVVLGALAFLLARRTMRAFGVMAALLVLAHATPASAEEEMLVREDAFDPASIRIPPPRFEFALKLGPYQPFDADTHMRPRYSAYFGQSDGKLFGKGNRVRAELSADVYVFNKFGLLGFTGAAGFWEAAGRARVCPTVDACDSEEKLTAAPLGGDSTVLNLFPLSLALVYKFDVFWRKWRVPLVPFARVGVDSVLWNVQAAGKQARKDGAPAYKVTLEPNQYAQGATWGWHVNAGLMIALDWIEPNAARSAYTFTGMKGSYLVFEGMFMFLDDFGKPNSWDLSYNTFQGGLAVEF